MIFTAGIGENSSTIRQLVCKEMDFFGIELDKEKNSRRESKIREINTENSKVKILIVPTNEELEIAQQAYDIQNL